tara:strand:+ start:5328 stop:5909 length:582 start_codon:yes stop_codon:yes gene_type:complete
MKLFVTILTILSTTSQAFINGGSFLDMLFKQEKPLMKTFEYAGDIEPTGYFDPLLVSRMALEPEVKYLREAELHHGRVAMCAALVLPLLDVVDKEGLAINKLSSVPLEEQTPFWLGVAAYECARMGAGWKNPFMEENKPFSLEEDYQPGNVFKVSSDHYPRRKLNVELSHGRLAMLGTAGYIAQELVSGKPIF